MCFPRTHQNQTIEDRYTGETSPPILTFPRSGEKGTRMSIHHRVPLSCGQLRLWVI
jgi:hypothetical protein